MQIEGDTEHLPRQEVVVSLRSVAQTDLIRDRPSGHYGDLGNYIGWKSAHPFCSNVLGTKFSPSHTSCNNP